MFNCTNPFAIVMCTYNGARYLDEQLRSLRAQAGVAEIIITDDRSTDGTVEILKRHAAEDPRIDFSVNPRLLGVSGNFQHAISLARAPWVALADQDDVWRPEKLARMRDAWDGTSLLMHHSSLKFCGEAPCLVTLKANARKKFRGSDWRRLLYRNSIVGHTVVMRRELAHALMPFPKGLPHDWWLGVGAAANGQVQFIDENLVFYRIHAQNTYHAAGSRLRRSREEHGLRLGILRALLAKDWPLRDREFAQRYLALLDGAKPGQFSWRLLQFYRRYASLFFASEGHERSGFTYWRRSFSAVLSATSQPTVVSGAPRTAFQ